MDPSSDTLYTAEQIRIPPDLPDILKNYTKHIIRTQPGNILKESVEYFGRLAKQKSDVGSLKRLNNMQLEALYNKFDQPGRTAVSRAELDDACQSFTIAPSQVNDVVRLGGWSGDRIPWLKCWALFVTSSAGSLPATLETIANLLSDNGRVRVEPIVEALQYLAEQDKTVEKSQVSEVVRQLTLNNFDCPVETVIDLVRAELQSTISPPPPAAPVAAEPPAPTAAPVQQQLPTPTTESLDDVTAAKSSSESLDSAAIGHGPIGEDNEEGSTGPAHPESDKADEEDASQGHREDAEVGSEHEHEDLAHANVEESETAAEDTPAEEHEAE